ncbi:MAG: transcriptional regulator [Thalassobaculum sp.]|uniref:helix-turn-helix domain-containing protein n=1 Tax=Thalassobaculum sp. TaxID=2022740 RepID=UPI0032EFCA8A
MTQPEIRPIRDAADHEAALDRIASLMAAEPGTAEGDELDVLVTLVEAYESRNHAIEAADPVALIEHLMEARALTRADLRPVLGSSGRVSEILNRRRPLTIAMIRGLHERFGLPAEVLIREYPLAG